MNKAKLIPLLILATVLFAGCAEKTSNKPDPFFEYWKKMAEESQGYSPSQVKHKVEITDIRTESVEEEVAAAPKRPLPRTPVSLRLSNADVTTVLRALAKAANLSLIINSNVTGSVSVNANKLPMSQVFEGIIKNQGLAWTWEGKLIRVMSIADMQREVNMEELQNQRLAKRKVSRQLEPLQTAVVGIKFADADELKEDLEQFLTRDNEGASRGSVVVDTHNNALIIQAIPQDSKRLIKLIDNLDRPRAQVMLKAHIVETTKDTARDLGIQWGGFFQSGQVDNDGNRFFVIPGGRDGFVNPETGRFEYIPQLGRGISEQGFGINFPADLSGGQGGQFGFMFGELGGSILEMQLSALQQDGKLNILSSPSITTLDNQTAFTENGERVPFVATNPEGDLEVKFEDAVLKLEIKPQIIDRDNLKLQILVQKDEVDPTRTVLGNPFIIKKHTETTLVVADGETVVISGLSRNREFNRSEGLPGLDDLPHIGGAFRRDNRGQTMEEVLIFITPTVLPYRQTAAVN